MAARSSGTSPPRDVATPYGLTAAGPLRTIEFHAFPLVGNTVPGVLLLVAAYYGAAHIGYALAFAGPVAAIVWPPVGVAIAFLYLAGLRLWPGVVIGDLLVNNYSALPLGSAIGQTTGNLLEVLLAAVLMRRLVRGSPLDSIRSLTGMLVAIAAGTAVSATIGCVALGLGGVISAGAIPNVWRTWWLGDLSGALIVIPLALTWIRPIRLDWGPGRTLEAVLLIAAVSGLSEVAVRAGRPLTYAVFPALIWAALRFGQRGATLAVAVATGFTVWNTTHYVGAFVFGSVSHSVLSAQLYIAVAALSTFCLAAVASEREEVGRRLTASRARLVGAADSERRRLERNLHDGAQGRLAALLVRLGVASELARERPETAAAALVDAHDELSQAIDELRELAHGIQPRLLTQCGLARAVESFVERSDIPIALLQLPAERLDSVTEATAYYVLTEALTNAQKHAHASSVQVRGRMRAQSLEIEVVDDGVGGAMPSEFGLQGLRDRVEATGGSVEIESPPGGGTRITAEIRRPSLDS